MTETPRILLVDDDEDSFVIVRKLLASAESGRYGLEWAATFDDGLARMTDPSLTAVLIDYRLGARDGLDLLDQAIALGIDAPVVVLTGQGGREIDLEAMRRGASDYLAKDQLDGATLERSIRYAAERHRLMKDLRTHADELASRAEELQHINNNLEQFVWAASHDLQTPLRTITYRLEYLRMLHDDQLEGSDSIDSAVEAATRMSTLLHDLLHYVRTGSDDLLKEPCDTRQLVSDIIAHFTVGDQASPPHIEVGAMPVVTANLGMLGEVFQNLIQNAIVHSDAENVSIQVSAARGADAWIFRIKDNGPGVQPVDIDRIFQPFRRGTREGATSGSGIGLALCRRIVERHGGRIWCESQPGCGATFCFTNPDVESPADKEGVHDRRSA